MMEAFLNNAAKYLFAKYGEGISDCALVFPNRRAGLFFTRYLSGLSDKPLWLPVMFTISDLMKEMSSLQLADPLSLNLELYRVFRKVTGSRETFDEFFNWGEILISDFDEIDKYMINAVSLFKNVTELKSIEKEFDYLTDDQIVLIKKFWSSFRQNNPSAHQNEFLKIWKALSDIYKNYNKRLLELNIAYEGMIFRDVADRITEGHPPALNFSKYFITGFNALNECEKRVFDYLKSSGRVEFLWDYDEHYISDDGHQAGYFIRDNLKAYPTAGFSQDSSGIGRRGTEVEIVAVPSNSGQAKVIPAIMGPFTGDDPMKTAIILPDERLLLPVLSSLSDNITGINVTMGYPVRDTPLFGLLMQLITLQKNCITSKDGTVKFPLSDVITVIQHPYCPVSIDNAVVRLKTFSDAGNMVSEVDLAAQSPAAGSKVFRKAPSGPGLIGYLVDILVLIAERHHAPDSESGSEDDKDPAGEVNPQTNKSFPLRELVFRVYTGLGRLRDVVADSDIPVGFETMVKIIKKVLLGTRIPFYGEPLSGIQIMGVLETRALDFENVIWLSVNEGVLPAMQINSSFIPYTLRKVHGLPVIEEQEAVFAYYFYRLMHRAAKVTLIYNTRSDGMFTGEMSRFIYQLKYDGSFKIRERNMVFNLLPPAYKPVIIQKNNDILKLLQVYTDSSDSPRYLSPNAINTYIDCSLRFYFRYIANLPEPEKSGEEIDMAVFGNLLHKAAQIVYEPLAGSLIDGAEIDSIIGNRLILEEYVARAFEDVLGKPKNHDHEKGDGLSMIVSEVILNYLIQLLVRDRELAPFRIKALENRFIRKTDIEIEGRCINIKIGGIIDRVDEIAGYTRVVDYKTGSDETSYRNMESLFERGSSRRRKAVFQTFIYSWIYLGNADERTRVTPVLYPVRKLFSNEPFMITHNIARGVYNPVSDFRELSAEFESGLKVVLSEIFDSDSGFMPTDDHDLCTYCPYNRLCHRNQLI